jgi:hypothetical protein
MYCSNHKWQHPPADGPLERQLEHIVTMPGATAQQKTVDSTYVYYLKMIQIHILPIHREAIRAKPIVNCATPKWMHKRQVLDNNIRIYLFVYVSRLDFD